MYNINCHDLREMGHVSSGAVLKKNANPPKKWPDYKALGIDQSLVGHFRILPPPPHLNEVKRNPNMYLSFMCKRIKNKNQVHIKDLNFPSFWERRKGNWNSFLFFLVLDGEREILLAEYFRTTLHSQPIRAKTRTKRDSLARVYSRTLTRLIS